MSTTHPLPEPEQIRANEIAPTSEAEVTIISPTDLEIDLTHFSPEEMEYLQAHLDVGILPAMIVSGRDFTQNSWPNSICWTILLQNYPWLEETKGFYEEVCNNFPVDIQKILHRNIQLLFTRDHQRQYFALNDALDEEGLPHEAKMQRLRDQLKERFDEMGYKAEIIVIPTGCAFSQDEIRFLIQRELQHIDSIATQRFAGEAKDLSFLSIERTALSQLVERLITAAGAQASSFAGLIFMEDKPTHEQIKELVKGMHGILDDKINQLAQRQFLVLTHIDKSGLGESQD